MDHIYNNYPSKEEMLLCVEDEKNPASINYKRVLTRPKIKVISVILNIILSLIGFAIILVFHLLLIKKVLLSILITIGILSIYIFIRLKSIIIFVVECYQIMAPDKLRMKCRFEPSCSDYMIAAVKKYGAINGLIRGIKRIRRCKYPNGGYDNP